MSEAIEKVIRATQEATRKRMENLGRECVRELERDGANKARVVIIGSLPRRGFPRGQYLGDHTDGRKIRMYEAFKLLGAIQQFMKRLSADLSVSESVSEVARVGEER